MKRQVSFSFLHCLILFCLFLFIYTSSGYGQTADTVNNPWYNSVDVTVLVNASLSDEDHYNNYLYISDSLFLSTSFNDRRYEIRRIGDSTGIETTFGPSEEYDKNNCYFFLDPSKLELKKFY